MAVSNTPVFVQTPKQGLVAITSGTGSSYVALVTAGSNGTKVTAVTATSNATTVETITLAISSLSSGSSFPYVLGAYSVPTLAGTDGATANADVLNGGPSNLIVGLPVDNDGQKYIFLQTGYFLLTKASTVVGAGLQVTVASVHGDF